MAEDFYRTLGINRNASASEIQDAYRKLAKKYHPDLNPDDAAAKDKFKKVQEAYDVLSDTKKKEMYDRYGSSFESFGGGAPGGGPGGGSWTFRSGPGGFENVDLSDLFGGLGGGRGGGGGGFSSFFDQFAGGGRGARTHTAPRRGADLQHAVSVPLKTVVDGGEVRLNVRRAGGKQETITVKIPPGVENGKKIRLRGQGEQSPTGGPAGDILIKVNVEPHPYFRRAGKNLEVTVPVTVGEAILGAKVDVPTPLGTVTLTIPPGTSSGNRLRIKGHGIRNPSGSPGDMFAEVRIVVPDGLDDKGRQLVEQFERDHPLDPREGLRW